MLERGIGYWLSPDGEAIPTPPRITLAEIMRELIDERLLNEQDQEAFLIDPNAYAISQGWSRIRICPTQKTAYVDFGSGKQRIHAKAVEELLLQLDLAEIKIKYTDEQGNYVSP